MVACKKIFEGKLSIKKARKQQNAIKKEIEKLDDRLNYIGPGKKLKPSTEKTLKDLHSYAKNLYIIRENNTEDEKLDIATGGDEISKLGDKEEPEIEKGLKIMTPRQMITRLPILLAQEQAGNNSQKLNNEIRQIIYSLYRSKNLSKQSIII